MNITDDAPGFDLPEETTDDSQPDWLAELTNDSLNAALGLDDSDADSIPDWLAEAGETQQTGSETRASSKQDLDWLSGALDEGDDASLEQDDLPDWMRGFSDAVDSDEETGDSPVDETAFGATWLSQGSETDEETPADTGLDWMHAFPPDEPSRDVPPEAVAPESTEGVQMFPDWLQAAAMQPEATGEDIAAASPDELPDWLRSDDLVAPDTKAENSDHTILLDWLNSADKPEVAPISDETLRPDWLTGHSDGTEPADSALQPEHPQVDNAPAPSEEAEPDAEVSWLSNLSISFSDAAGGDTLEADPESALEHQDTWLDVLPAGEHSDDDTGIPTEDDWVSALTDAINAQNDMAGYTVEDNRLEFDGEPVPDAALSGSLPDWMIGSEPDGEHVESDEMLPDALFDDAAGNTADAGPVAGDSLFVDEEPVGAPSEPEIDWLAGLGTLAEPGAAPEGGLDDEVEAIVPNWLSNLASDAEIQPTPQAGSAAVISRKPAGDNLDAGSGRPAVPLNKAPREDMPSWLEDLPELTARQTNPAEIFSPQPFTLPADGEGPAQANVPAWLQGLRPEGDKSLPQFPELLSVPPEDSGLVVADIPDWVIALQPSADAALQAPSAIAGRGLPAETEGPIAGLGGVIPALASVDMPEGYKVIKAELPQNIQKQAQLWQTLLEHPRFGQRPVVSQAAKKQGAGLWLTLATTILLFTAIIAALLLPAGALQEGALLRFTPLYASQSGAETLARTVETLQAGDVVVVAVEYGASRAEEMTAVAFALLDHLSSREVDIRFVSTMPEGVMTAYTLQRRIQDSDPVEFIVSQTSGVAAQLATSAVDADLVVVLTTDFDRLQWWVEQNASLPDAQQHRIAAGVSASIRSLTAPYLRNADFSGWIAGYPESLLYQALLNKDLTGQMPIVNALMLGHWLAAGLMLCGLFYYLVSPRKGTR